ncbi:MAG: hypothetical protein ACKOAF_04325 [Actinomycetes bacterium]
MHYPVSNHRHAENAANGDSGKITGTLFSMASATTGTISVELFAKEINRLGQRRLFGHGTWTGSRTHRVIGFHGQHGNQFQRGDN